jgi:uncharacterized protein YfaT (DUF1175 family)
MRSDSPVKKVPLSISLSLFALFVCLLTSSCSDSKTEAQSPTEKSHATKKRSLLDDSNHNGIPDGAELRSYEDRENFRDWFTAIAEMQFYKPSDAWNPEQRDCSGLVRFAWREALRKHDSLWFQKMGAEYESVAPDVASYDLETGVLKEKIFRTKDGLFNKSDLTDGTFREFADAGSLMKYNAVFIGKDRSQLKRGDLLFYFQPFVQKYPYHVMLYIGEARTNSEGARDWVVYHTGTSAEDKGTVKKVRINTLDQHPDPRWRPVVNNKNFLGFYRLKILE